MSEYIITLEQMHDLIESAAVEAVDGYKCGVVKQIWSFPKLSKIVRCRDCKHGYKADLSGNWYECMKTDGNGDYARWDVEPDGFCAWGERLEK